MDLLASAVLSLVAGLKGQSQSPSAESAAVWLYSEIVPAAVLTPAQADTVARIVAFRQAPEVPESLIQQSIADVRSLFSLSERSM